MLNPTETLRAYVEAFETLDPDTVVPFYHLPCTFVGPAGPTIVSDVSGARGLAAALMHHAKSQGYRRSVIRDLTERRLANTLTHLAGEFVRLDAEGQEISVFGFTYIMVRVDQGWRIVVAVAHDAIRND